MDLTVFVEEACELDSCVISHYWASSTESKTKYKIKSYLYDSIPVKVTELRKTNFSLTFIFLCLSPFSPPSGPNK